jgi:hypothetical protein
MTPVKISMGKNSKDENKPAPTSAKGRVSLEIYGEEIVEKTIKMSGNSGRIYLPTV